MCFMIVLSTNIHHHHNSNLTGTRVHPPFVPFWLLLPHVVVLVRRCLLADSGKNCDSHFSYSIGGGLTCSVDIVIFRLTIRDPFLIRTPFLFLEQFELHKMKPNKNIETRFNSSAEFPSFPALVAQYEGCHRLVSRPGDGGGEQLEKGRVGLQTPASNQPTAFSFLRIIATFHYSSTLL